MLKARYLQWRESPQGPAPYFVKRYPKRVAPIMKARGKGFKYSKRLPVPISASDIEIQVALHNANVEFDHTMRAYADPNNRMQLEHHEIRKAAIGWLNMQGIAPGEGRHNPYIQNDAVIESMGNEDLDWEVTEEIHRIVESGTEDDMLRDVTVHEAITMYLDTTDSRNKEKYERVLMGFLRDVGDRMVNQSFNRLLHDWCQNQLETRGVSTVKKDISIILAALRYAIKANGLGILIHKPNMPKHIVKQRPILSREELKALFAQEMRPWERQCLMASLCMGAINSELLTMETRKLGDTLLLHVPYGKVSARVRSVPMPWLTSWEPINFGERDLRTSMTALVKAVQPDASPYSLRHSNEHFLKVYQIGESERAAINGWANQGRFHQYGEAGKHDDERLMPLIDVMHETWDWLFNSERPLVRS